MGVLDEILRKTAGAAGKYVSNVGNAWSQILGQDVRLGPGGSALGASLQSFGGQSVPSPFVFVNPPKTYAAGDTLGTSIDYSNATYDPLYGQKSYNNTYYNPPTGGAGDGGSGGSGGGGDNGGGTPDPKDPYYSRLNSILERLAMMRDIAQRNIGTARSVRDEIIGNIGSTYQNLRERAGQSRDAALENLGQEDIGVQNLYGRAGGTARRAMESALTRNRMMARAMNRLNSSFYDDRQAEAVEGGRRSISDLATEEAGKRAAIGTRTTETKNWFENKITDLGQEEAQLKSQAEGEYQNAVKAASDMERAYGIDSIGAAEQAQNEYQSRLDQISQYIQGKALRLAEIAATAGNQGGIINAFQAIGPELQRTLGNASGLNAAAGLGNALRNQWSSFGGGGGGTDMSGFATMKEDPESRYYRQLKELGLMI